MGITKKEVDKTLKAIGSKIRSIRTAQGLTLEEVEARGYPSWRHLQKVEAGKNITLVTLINLSYALRCDLNDLLP